MLNIVAGIILYNPDKSVFSRIEEYAHIFSSVIVFDNTEGHNNYECIPEYDNVKYYSLQENKGLAFAYNYIINTIDETVDYMCMLDQDSQFADSQIKKLIAFIAANKVESTAIYSPAIQYRYHSTQTGKEYELQEWVITSGSFINIKVLKDNNLKFDECYFIDRFEVDMCKQLRLLGYNIVQVNSSILRQELGTDSGHRHPNHSALRHYYLARNRLYFNKKYYGLTKRTVLDILQSARHIILIALYEDKAIKKIEACIIGWNDYFKKSFGKTNRVF